MECSQDPKIIAELFNECRTTWNVYYAPICLDQLRDALYRYPNHFMCSLDEGCIIGHIDDCFSGGRFHIAYNDMILVSKQRCKSSFHVIAVLDKLLNEFTNWAKEQKANRINWTMHTGNWQAVQKLLERKYAAKQSGISLVSEF